MTYTITAWKDGSPKGEVDAKTTRAATKIAKEMIAGKRGYTCDAVDICEYDDREFLQNKTTFTLLGNAWKKDTQYIGEF